MPAPKDPIKYNQWKENISKANKGSNAYWYGRHHSKETIEKIKKYGFKNEHIPWNKGIPHSEETKRKISESKKGIPSPTKGKTFKEIYGEERTKEINAKHSKSVTGRLLSKETKKKIGEAGKGRIVTEDTRMKIRRKLKGKHSSPETEFKTGQSFEERFGMEKAQNLKERIRNIYKNKTFEERYGTGRANEIKQKMHKTNEHNNRQFKGNNNLKKWSVYNQGKTLEEIHGIEKAREIKEQQSKRLKGKTHIELYGKENAEIRKEIMSKRTKGKTFEEIYGEERAKEIKAKHSKSLKGKTYEEVYGEENAKTRKESISKALRGRTYKELYGEEDAQRRQLQQIEWRSKLIFPKRDTKIEVKIQMFLKELGYEYFTHQYMKDIKHGYQSDILIPALNLVIECDGDYWHKYPIGTDLDHIRTKELLEEGFKVLRLWECEIKMMDIDKFKEDIDIIKMEEQK